MMHRRHRFQPIGARALTHAVQRDVRDIERIHDIQLEIEAGVYERCGAMPSSVDCFRGELRDALLLPFVRRQISAGDTVRIHICDDELRCAVIKPQRPIRVWDVLYEEGEHHIPARPKKPSGWFAWLHACL